LQFQRLIEKTLECTAVPHPNERVELAMQILECRRRLRRAGWDDAAVEDMKAEMKRLEQKLRELDE
jgi:hypothetical protein